MGSCISSSEHALGDDSSASQTKQEEERPSSDVARIKPEAEGARRSPPHSSTHASPPPPTGTGGEGAMDLLHPLVPEANSVPHSETVLQDVDDNDVVDLSALSASGAGPRTAARNPLTSSGRFVTTSRRMNCPAATSVTTGTAATASAPLGESLRVGEGGPSAVARRAIPEEFADGADLALHFSPLNDDGSSSGSTGFLGPCPSTGLLELMSCGSMKGSQTSTTDFDHSSRSSRAATRIAGAIPSLECSFVNENPRGFPSSRETRSDARAAESTAAAELRAAFGGN